MKLKTALIAAAAALLMGGSAFAGDVLWLKPHSVVAYTLADLEEADQMLEDKDQQAIAEMIQENRVFISLNRWVEIFQTNEGFDAGVSGFIEFRMKGFTQRYWTYSNRVEKR